MIAFTAWFLVTTSGANVLTYSPALASYAECQRLYSEVHTRVWSAKCIELRIVK